MISVSDARASILARTWRKSPALPPLSAAVSLVLAEGVTCDVDSPPHDKSLVAGFAWRPAGGLVFCLVAASVTLRWHADNGCLTEGC